MGDVELEMGKLTKLIRAMKGKTPSARVGIFAKDNARADSSAKNATIGAVYEFGTLRHPQQSFLAVPLQDMLGKKLEGKREEFEESLGEVTKQASLESWAEIVGETSLEIVQEAFDSSGYGKWSTPLKETGQLRDSVSYEVT